MNNPYLTKIKEIKKEISELEEEQGKLMRVITTEIMSEFDRQCLVNRRQEIGREIDNCQAKLQTAVEFLQMTKQILQENIMFGLKGCDNGCAGIIQADIAYIADVLKEAGENNG